MCCHNPTVIHIPWVHGLWSGHLSVAPRCVLCGRRGARVSGDLRAQARTGAEAFAGRRGKAVCSPPETRKLHLGLTRDVLIIHVLEPPGCNMYGVRGARGWACVILNIYLSGDVLWAAREGGVWRQQHVQKPRKCASHNFNYSSFDIVYTVISVYRET